MVAGLVTGISLVEICCGSLRDVFMDVISIIVAIGSRTIRMTSGTTAGNTTLLDRFYRVPGAGTGDVLLDREVEALTNVFQLSNIGRYSGAQVVMLREIHDDGHVGEDL
ncbi:hypothetical protein Tco_1032765 [Tanacetum coccineum]|uniref:Uncharacterized protein n=1 Tax=Tanacetum coccineum TaxID=301880 RepID=A0ABQ5GCZ6_9ASTR